jgi:hypothetical protein
VAKKLVLAEVPAEPRALELWAQHAAGMILFERARAAGIAAIDPELPEEHRRQAERAVDATMYALMMLIDGVSGGIANEERAVGLRFLVEIREGGRVTYSLDLSEGDGMCMGFHGWREGTSGSSPCSRSPAPGTNAPAVRERVSVACWRPACRRGRSA